MFFFLSYTVAGAHGTYLGAGAFAYAYTSCHCKREAMLLIRILEMGLYIVRMVMHTGSQISKLAVGLYHFTGVHFPFGVPYLFKFTKGLYQLFTKHYLQQVCLRLSITMLS